jgi:hypothetical protein
MNAVEKALIETCRKEPDEPTNLAAYHDWLLDHGRGVDAVAVRETMTRKVEKFSDLKGKIVTKVERLTPDGEDELIFHLLNGQVCKLYHEQNCCESVSLEDVDGDLQDLVNTPLLTAEEVSNQEEDDDGGGNSHTWTFYKFSTVKGHVTLRWYGSSNGYYSEAVDFMVDGERVW